MSISSEITRINTNIANAYTAMQSKGATLPATQNSANLASTVNTITGGGVNIQGIIEEYEVASGGNVSAGDFVKFIENIENVNYKAINSSNYNGYAISAVELSSNKVFITYGSGSLDSSRTLYGVVITISGTTITQGSNTQLSSDGHAGNVTSIVKLAEDKVFIVHSYGGDYYLYGIICTISGTTITAGTDTAIINNTTYVSEVISAVLIDDDKVFITHSYSSTHKLYGIVCTISGTTITIGTDTAINSSNYRAFTISTVKLDTDKVFITYSTDPSSSRQLSAIVCTISGTTITKGSDTQINNNNYTGFEISTVALTNSKVFIAHSTGRNYYLNSIVCTISGTTITKGTSLTVINISYSGYKISTVLINASKVFIAHSRDSSYYLYGIICTIDNTTITGDTDTALISSVSEVASILSAVKTGNKIFIAHSYGSGEKLYGIIGYQVTVNTLSNVNEIGGIAKEAGTAGDTIEVYVPDI